MSNAAEDFAQAHASKSAEAPETRQDPATPASPPKKVFVDAAQPPPLRSQWSSIVKQPQSKGKEGPVPAFSAQAMKQDTPGSPAAGTANTGTSAPPHPRLSTAHQKLASFGNGKQSSPKTADKDLNIANGFASPSSTALSPGTPPLEAPSTKPQSPEKQSQPSSGASQSAAQTQPKKEVIRDASPPARPAWKKPELVDTSATPLNETQTAWPTLGGMQEAHRKRRGSSAPTTPNSSQTLKPSPPSSESAAVIPLSKVGDSLAHAAGGTSQAMSVGEASGASVPASSALDRASIASAPERAGAATGAHASKTGTLRGRSNSGGPLAPAAASSINRRRAVENANGTGRAAPRVRPAANTGVNASAAATSSRAQVSGRAGAKPSQNSGAGGAAAIMQPSEASSPLSARASDTAAPAIHSSKSLEPAPQTRARGDPNLPASRSFDSQAGNKQRSYSQQQRQYEQLAAAQMGGYPGMQRHNGTNAAPQMFYPPSMYYPQAAFAVPGGQMNPYMTAVAQEQLLAAVAAQIEYYFSVENLCKDLFLRRKMDDDGWIPLAVIASFNRVRMLTADVGVILQALLGSQVIQTSPDGLKMRPQSNHQNWVLPKGERDQAAHSAATPQTAPAAAFGGFAAGMVPPGGQLRVGPARGGRRRDEGGDMTPRRSSGEGAGSRGQLAGSRAAVSAPASPSGKGQLLGISPTNFRNGPASSAGKAASEASTPLPHDQLDEGMFQHSEETSASSTAEQSSLDDNQVHHDRPASGASLPSVSDAEVDRLLLIVQLGDSEPSSSDASSAEAAILGLQQELCDEHEKAEGVSVDAKSETAPHLFSDTQRNGLAGNDAQSVLAGPSGAIGWLIAPASIPPPASGASAAASDGGFQPWASLPARASHAALLDKQGFRPALYRHLRDACRQAQGPTAVVDALFLFWASFLRHHSSTVLQHDFEALAQRQAEQRHFAGLLRLFQHYSVMLKGNFQDDLYARFEQLAVKYHEEYQWQQGLETLQAFQQQSGNPDCSNAEAVSKGKLQPSAPSVKEAVKPPKVQQAIASKNKANDAAQADTGASAANMDQALSAGAPAFVPHAAPAPSSFALANGNHTDSSLPPDSTAANGPQLGSRASLADLAHSGKAKSLKPAGSVDAVIQAAI